MHLLSGDRSGTSCQERALVRLASLPSSWRGHRQVQPHGIGSSTATARYRLLVPRLRVVPSLPPARDRTAGPQKSTPLFARQQWQRTRCHAAERLSPGSLSGAASTLEQIVRRLLLQLIVTPRTSRHVPTARGTSCPAGWGRGTNFALITSKEPAQNDWRHCRCSPATIRLRRKR